MVTRNIKANTATQVNANLIGVQVRPTVVPPTYNVGSLDANVRVYKRFCDTSWNGKPMLIVNTNEVWGYTGNQQEYNGTVYDVWSCMNVTYPINFLTNPNDEITDNTQFYYYDDGTQQVALGPLSDSKLSTNGYTGYLYQFAPTGDVGYYASDKNDMYDLDGGFFKDNQTGSIIGKNTSDALADDVMMHCSYGEEIPQGEDVSYYSWIIDDFGPGNIELFSDTRNPSVGYNLMGDFSLEEYLSPVTSVTEGDEEADPGYTEDIDCTLSYSVDGSTWTDWPENMTDANNVISNIPRYMYLKFSQDVVITEE